MAGVNFSSFTLEASPAVTDFVVGYRTAVLGGERRTALSSLNTLFQANITTGLTANSVLLAGASGQLTASALTYSGTTLSVPDAFSLTSAGSIDLTAGGTNENITITPSGTGSLGLFDTPLGNAKLELRGSSSTTPASAWVVTGTPLIAAYSGGATSGDGDIILSNAAQSGGAGAAATVVGRKSRGTLAAPVAVANGDTSLNVLGSLYDGGAFRNTAAISFIADAGASSGNAPQRIEFLTGDTTSRTTRMGISSAGGVYVPSTNTSGIQLYNTADQTTNYERLRLYWTGNVATVETQFAGTGTPRVLRLRDNRTTNNATIDVNRGNTSGFISINGSVSDSAATTLLVSQSLTNTSGTTAGILAITPTYNQASGTAANTDLLINRTQTAVGSGAQNLIDAQVGAVSQWRVGNTGNSVQTGSLTSGTPNGGTAGAWKFGIRVAAVSALDTTQYIQLDVGGTLYKLALIT